MRVCELLPRHARATQRFTLLRSLAHSGLCAANSSGGVASGAVGVVQPGRDHWPQAMSFLFSGDGIAEGQLIGANDRRGELPAERRVGPGDFLATLYRHLGIDAERGTMSGPEGRTVSLLQQGGAPIRELSPPE